MSPPCGPGASHPLETAHAPSTSPSASPCPRSQRSGKDPRDDLLGVPPPALLSLEQGGAAGGATLASLAVGDELMVRAAGLEPSRPPEGSNRAVRVATRRQALWLETASVSSVGVALV